jgi:hypothetical protein
VSLRLLRAYDDMLATVADPQLRLTLLRRAEHVVTGYVVRQPQDDLAKLQQRLASIMAKAPAG